MSVREGARARRRRCVIVADDSDEQRLLVCPIVEAMGFDVVEASSGREMFWALERCYRIRHDADVIVIADVRMPVYNGLDVLEAWRGEDSYPLIVTTSFPDEQVAARVRGLGGILLAKPFSLSALRSAVETCVPSH